MANKKAQINHREVENCDSPKSKTSMAKGRKKRDVEKKRDSGSGQVEESD